MQRVPDIPEYLRQRFAEKLTVIFAGAPAVSRERFDPWMRAAWVASDGDASRVVWHISRLATIGSSEIGVAVLERAGAEDAFSSIRKILEGKLLIAPPERRSFAMRVADALRGEAVDAFHARFDCATDEAALAALRAGTRIGTRHAAAPRRPWMSGMPDDLVVIGGRRYLVNVKVALNDRHPLETPSRNVYQLHQQRLIAEDHGIAVDGLVLAKFTRDADGYPDLVPLEVEIDAEKDAAIIAAGDHVWALRNDGIVPAAVQRRVLNLGNLPGGAALRQLADEFATYDAIASSAYARSASAKEKLAQTLSDSGRVCAPGTTVVGATSVHVTHTFDLEAAVLRLGPAAERARTPVLSARKMQAHLEATGVDMRSFEEPGGYDQMQIQSLLEENGADPQEFLRQTLSVGLDRNRGLARDLKAMAAPKIGALQKELLVFARQEATQRNEGNTPAPRSSKAAVPAP